MKQALQHPSDKPKAYEYAGKLFLDFTAYRQMPLDQEIHAGRDHDKPKDELNGKAHLSIVAHSDVCSFYPLPLPRGKAADCSHQDRSGATCTAARPRGRLFFGEAA